jgi:hypothetical protein
MAESLFHRDSPEKRAPAKLNPHELIEPEVVHLKKGYSIRHGAKPKPTTPGWLVFLAFCGLAWLYLMDPPYHAWYKGEAVKTYLYLHNYGSTELANSLAATGIFRDDELTTLNNRTGAFQNYYPSADVANKSAEKIIDYMNNVKHLHEGRYQDLDPVGRMRCLLFVRTGIYLPTQWDFLDPTVNPEP